jgi:hypothetical protein
MSAPSRARVGDDWVRLDLVQDSVTKCHKGEERGSKIRKKCYILFEWPLIRSAYNETPVYTMVSLSG